MKAPSVISREEPQFTDVARKRKISTTVTLSLVVDPQGLPKDVRILHSGAEKFKKQKDRDAALTLDARAIEAVQHYRFEPALRDGLPVPVQINVEVSFQIF